MKKNKFLTTMLSMGLALTLSVSGAACGDGAASGDNSTDSSSVAKPTEPVKLDAVNVDETVRNNIDAITDADVQDVLDGNKKLFALVYKGVTVGDAFAEFISELDQAIKDGKIDGDLSADDQEISDADGLPDTLSSMVSMFKCGFYDVNGKQEWCLERISTDNQTVAVTQFSDTFSKALFKYSLSSVGNDEEKINLPTYYLAGAGGRKIAFDSVIANFLGGTIKGEAIVDWFEKEYPQIDPTVLKWAAGLTVKNIYDFSGGDFSCAGDITFGQVIKFFKDVETAQKEKGETSKLNDYDFTSLYNELDKLIGKIKIAEYRQEFKKLSLYSVVDAVSTVSVNSLKAQKADADAFSAYLKDVYDSASTLGELKVKAGKTVDFKNVADLFKKLVPELDKEEK